MAYPTAYWLTKTKYKQFWLLLIILPSWINLLLKAYAFLRLFCAYGLANTLLENIGIGTKQLLFTDFSFVFVAVYIFIPFMILPIFNSLEKLNPTFIDTSSDLGGFRLADLPKGNFSFDPWWSKIRLSGRVYSSVDFIYVYPVYFWE